MQNAQKTTTFTKLNQLPFLWTGSCFLLENNKSDQHALWDTTWKQINAKIKKYYLGYFSILGCWITVDKRCISECKLGLTLSNDKWWIEEEVSHQLSWQLTKEVWGSGTIKEDSPILHSVDQWYSGRAWCLGDTQHLGVGQEKGKDTEKYMVGSHIKCLRLHDCNVQIWKICANLAVYMTDNKEWKTKYELLSWIKKYETHQGTKALCRCIHQHLHSARSALFFHPSTWAESLLLMLSTLACASENTFSSLCSIIWENRQERGSSPAPTNCKTGTDIWDELIKLYTDKRIRIQTCVMF